MILDLLFLAAAVFAVYRTLAALTPRGSHRPVGAKKKSPQVVTALAYAQRLFSERRYVAAEKAFLEVLKMDHKNINAYSHLGRIYSAQKNYSEAIESYQSAAQLEPSAHNFFALGQAFYENKNFVKAIAAFEKSIMFEPAAGRYVALSRAYYRLANAKQAIATMEKAIELDPEEKNWELLGDLHIYNHDAIGARKAFEQVLKLNPKNPRALRAMARLPKIVR